MFTIIIPLYNKISSVAATIESVLGQTFGQFELIVINDGSTDGSEKIVFNYNDSRIKYFSQENKGLSATRNEGIKLATFEFITILDADDVLNPDFLEKMFGLIIKYEDCAVYSASYDVEKRGKIHKRSLTLPFEVDGIIEDYFTCQLRNTETLVWTCVSVVRRNAFERAGMYDVKLSRGEDLDIWFRIFPEGKLAFLNESLAVYGDSDINRMTSGAIGKLSAGADILFNLTKLNAREKRYPQLKHFLDLYRLQHLRPYYLQGNNDKAVNSILADVGRDSFTTFSTLFYRVVPRMIIRPAFNMLKSVKRLVA